MFSPKVHWRFFILVCICTSFEFVWVKLKHLNRKDKQLGVTDEVTIVKFGGNHSTCLGLTLPMSTWGTGSMSLHQSTHVVANADGKPKWPPAVAD
jgi:hypothetical protein